MPPSPVVLVEIQLCPILLFEDFHDGLKVAPDLQFNSLELLLACSSLDLLKDAVEVRDLQHVLSSWRWQNKVFNHLQLIIKLSLTINKQSIFK
jgi:hypothetical protein